MPKLFRTALAATLLACSTLVGATSEDQAASRPAAQPVPTFTRDVAPILYRNCVQCRWGDQTWEEMQYTGFIYSVAPAAVTTASRP